MITIIENANIITTTPAVPHITNRRAVFISSGFPCAFKNLKPAMRKKIITTVTTTGHISRSIITRRSPSILITCPVGAASNTAALDSLGKQNKTKKTKKKKKL